VGAYRFETKAYASALAVRLVSDWPLDFHDSSALRSLVSLSMHPQTSRLGFCNRENPCLAFVPAHISDYSRIVSMVLEFDSFARPANNFDLQNGTASRFGFAIGGQKLRAGKSRSNTAEKKCFTTTLEIFSLTRQNGAVKAISRQPRHTFVSHRRKYAPVG
jgi:hypothetical protein